MMVKASPVEVRLGRGGFVAAAASFAAMIGFGMVVGHRPPTPLVLIAGVVATAMALPLLRQRRPLLLYALVAGVGIAVIADNRSANFVWLALLAITGWCALTGGLGQGLAYWVPSMVLFTVEWTSIKPDPGWSPWLAGNTFMLLAGQLSRRQLSLVAQLRAAQAGLAARARAEERNRISRDLHDVIAHTLTVSLLHVMSARLAVEHDPADAARALAEAERLGRESLAEVRQVVGFLRDEPGGSDGTAPGDEIPAPALHAPLPSATDLPTLAERFQSAGVDVTLSVYGDTGRLPATVGLAAYRILQEALTNVIKHAPAAPTTAVLTVSAREAILTVDSLGPPGNGQGSGHGVPSMRERAESLGGTCRAGPSGAGWQVRATFPLAAPEATE